MNAGTRVVSQPTPASRALYGYPVPAAGTLGTVTPVSFGRGSRTSLPGPHGGLVYVRWDDGLFCGVPRFDLRRLGPIAECQQQEAVTCPGCGCTVGWDCADIRLQAEAFADYETRGGPLAFDAWVATKDHDPRAAALIRHELKAARVRLARDRGARRNGAA